MRASLEAKPFSTKNESSLIATPAAERATPKTLGNILGQRPERVELNLAFTLGALSGNNSFMVSNLCNYFGHCALK